MVGKGFLPWMAEGIKPGSVIAGYRLEEQIGRGGMAVVFRARDERLNRQVALKILSPALAADRAFRHRFIRESHAAAAVDDPNIIPIYEAGESEGVLFIAMRLVRGGDIKSLVAEQGPLPPARAEWIVSAVASALDTAHAHCLVHRDVKPHNMLLEVRPGRPDHVYLSDFGLSKASVGSSGVTGSGQFLGTVDYCAPEQIQGKAVDGRADQYGLGCTAFELLCGVPPFVRDHGMAALWAHISTSPPLLSSQRNDLSPDVNPVFAKVLAKDPADRYSTCREFADALRLALGVQSYAVEGGRPGGPTADPGDEAPTPVPPDHQEPVQEEPAEPVPPTKELAGAGGASARSPLAPPVPMGSRRRRRQAAVEAAAPVPSQPAGASVGGAPAVAFVGKDGPGAITMIAPPAESPLFAELHPSHPSHPSQPLGQTTNLRTIRPSGRSPDVEHPETDVSVRGPDEPTELSPGAGPGGRRRNVLIGAAVLAAVLAAAAGLVLTTSPAAPSPARAVSEVFPQQHFGNGVLAVRHWTLSGQAGSVFTDMVTLTNQAGTAQLVSYTEPIPAAIAPSLTDVRFTPTAQLVDAGRAAQWKLRVPAHGHVVVGYRVAVPLDGTTKVRLARWATDLDALAASLRSNTTPGHTRLPQVRSLSITPRHLRLVVGAVAHLKLSGSLAHNKNAPASDLSAVTWTSSNPSVATVNRFGKVSTLSVGTARLTATLGQISTSAQVTVISATTPNPGTGTSYTPPNTGPPPPPPTSTSTSHPNPIPTVTPSPLSVPMTSQERPQGHRLLHEHLGSSVNRPEMSPIVLAAVYRAFRA